MKHFLSVAVFLLVLSASSVCAQNLPQAEEFYRQGRFADALTQYEQALKDYPNDPFVYYNIGNCYFKMGSIGLAAANYYRAFKLRPRNGDIRHNLSLALAQSGETLVPAGVPPILHKTFFTFSVPELKGLVYLTGWLTCLSIGLWFLLRKGGKWVIVLLLIWIGCTGWFYVRYQEENIPLAFIASPIAEVRSGPGTNFPVSASVKQGHLVQILDRKDNWQQVIIRSEGLKGWVESSTLEII